MSLRIRRRILIPEFLKVSSMPAASPGTITLGSPNSNQMNTKQGYQKQYPTFVPPVLVALLQFIRQKVQPHDARGCGLDTELEVYG